MASQAPQTAQAQQPAQNNTVANEFDNSDLAVDDNSDTDSAHGSSVGSETTSIASHYCGHFENGRRYQSVRSEEYYQPTDEKQWESMEAGHLLMLILDSQRANTLFRSPILPNAQHIIDVGTGSGDWALDVADRYPNITVHGVDLQAPPQSWTAPNCVFEVDDLSKDWTWSHKFDLVHMRHLIGAFSNLDWEKLYARCYSNIIPGGWIEQVEADPTFHSVDGPIPSDSALNWKDMIYQLAEDAGRPFDVHARMKERMEAAGFKNIQMQEYKVPMGTWPKLEVYKDAGRVNKTQFMRGVEGWCLYLLTKYGRPTPWTPEEVQVWLAKLRQEIEAGHRVYQVYRRVWGQKPLRET